MLHNGSGRAEIPEVTRLNRSLMIQPDEIIRSHRKTLAISIDRFGRLIVRAPKACAKERIFAFLEEKENWILRKKSERAGAGIDLPSENLDGDRILLFGEEYTLRLKTIKTVYLDEREKQLFLPKEKAKEKLVAFFKKEAKIRFTVYADDWAERMGVCYKKLSVMGAKTRWGSCSFDNSLHFSFRLLYVPKEVAEYVIVHELAHTKHKNHSPLFWAEVKKYQPDYKEKRKWLKTHALLMEIF